MPSLMTYEPDEGTPPYPSYPDVVAMMHVQSVCTEQELAGMGMGMESRMRSLRTDIFLPRSTVGTKAQVDYALTALYKEDHHNYDYIDGPQGQYGRCRCELRIITGERCLKYFGCDKDGQTPSEANNHWAWHVDIAPRGKLCPVVKGVCNPAVNPACGTPQPCNILVLHPRKEWVLEQDEGAEEGTVPGRVQDLILPGKCPKCQDADTGRPKWDVDEETNRTVVDQNPKLHPGGSLQIKQPMQYKPLYGNSVHWSLEIGKYYHIEDVKKAGVLWANDLWIESNDGGMTYAQHIDANVDAQVLIPLP